MQQTPRTTTRTTPKTTPRSTRNKLASAKERAIAAAIGEEMADLTATINRLGERTNWHDPAIALMEADFDRMRASRAEHLRRAEQLRERSW